MNAFLNGTNYGITAQKGGGLGRRGPSLRTCFHSQSEVSRQLPKFSSSHRLSRTRPDLTLPCTT